jgi:hypothetical protein
MTTPVCTRGTSNADDRGSTETRRRRRAWLLERFGDGEKAPCYRCGVFLDNSTVTADRIFPGCLGGRYVRANIRPACNPCNMATGGALGASRVGVRSLTVKLIAIADLVAEYAEILARHTEDEIGPHHLQAASDGVGRKLREMHPGHRMPSDRSIRAAVNRRARAA